MRTLLDVYLQWQASGVPLVEDAIRFKLQTLGITVSDIWWAQQAPHTPIFILSKVTAPPLPPGGRIYFGRNPMFGTVETVTDSLGFLRDHQAITDRDQLRELIRVGQLNLEGKRLTALRTNEANV